MGSNRFDPSASVVPNFTGLPQFAGFTHAMFDGQDWSMGYDAGAMVLDERPFRGRRTGPGGPMRRGGAEGLRDHPYERRDGWSERRDDAYSVDRTRVRETRQIRSYRDLDAPQEATPELTY